MKGHTYVSKEPDANGLFPYTDEENKIWAELMARQANILPGRACPEYLQALDVINFPKDRVPQLKEVTTTLMRETGWSVEPVPALISFKKFFTLLAERKFPAATFIRLREEMDYLQEPDIFHEVFGHCPLLVNPVYANFMQKYGEMGLQVAKEDRAMLARLYWFTVEFGLMKRNGKLGIYGAGIVSSKGESVYALESRVPERKPLDLVACFRTPYRYDIFQHTYFVIESFEELFDLVNRDLLGAVAEAKRLGMLPPNYDVDGDADAINARLMVAP
jgi:phenylalanine-4-hydroxylase